ncbi:MAG: NTP transferase domain-containing protein [Candidatus Doudnabacteria bacterium]|nr:NTP transferase domain-containing protein [Candidatus Doudnabacteria bacterium]
MNTQIIILAAGKGTRMGHPELPKVLVELRGKPLISYLLEEVSKLRLSPAVIVVGFKSELVKQALGPGYIYASQLQQLGTANAVAEGLKYTTAENVLALYGDMPLIKSESLNRLIAYHDETKSVLTMFVAKVPNFEDEFSNFLGFGRIVRDEAGRIAEIKEYVNCSKEEQAITEVNPGIYIFKTNWLLNNIGKIPQSRQGEFYLTDAVSLAREQQIVINFLAIEPHEVFGVNTLSELKQAERFL